MEGWPPIAAAGRMPKVGGPQLTPGQPAMTAASRASGGNNLGSPAVAGAAGTCVGGYSSMGSASFSLGPTLNSPGAYASVQPRSSSDSWSGDPGNGGSSAIGPRNPSPAGDAGTAAGPPPGTGESQKCRPVTPARETGWPHSCGVSTAHCDQRFTRGILTSPRRTESRYGIRITTEGGTTRSVVATQNSGGEPRSM